VVICTLYPAKEPLVHIGQEAAWATEPVWTTWRKENSWPYWDSNSDPSVVHHVANRYTDYAMGGGDSRDIQVINSRKNAIFLDVTPCKYCVNRRFGGTYRRHLQGIKPASEEPASVGGFASEKSATCPRWFLASRFLYPEDGGDTFLRNVGLHNIYTAPHPRRQHSS
jgi:hypothetical protein